jgi:hypothetical protein
MDGVAYGLIAAAQLVGDVTSTRAPGAGQQELTPAQDKGVARALACLQGLTLGLHLGSRNC